MRSKRLLYLLFFSLIISYNSFSQIQKGSIQVGLSGAALFELNSAGLNGGLINLHGEYSISNRFIVGIQPYYALTDEKMTYAYDLLRHELREIQKDVFRSFGANLEFKFVLRNHPKFKPYSSVILGAGYSSYHVYHNNVFGDMEPEDHGKFVNLNLGIGLGAYYRITKSWFLDAKFMYTDVTANKNVEASSYIYPSIGIIRTF